LTKCKPFKGCLQPCVVNGLKLHFIFDTGASNVALSLSEALFMLKNGYLNETDLKGSSYSQIANGEIVENTTVILKELEVGGIKLYNIEAVIIHELTAPLLLGQSAIQELGKIQLDGDELIIMNSTSNNNSCTEAKKNVEQAKVYYYENLYHLSSESYKLAYDYCPEALDCFSIYSLGNSYRNIDNFILATKYLEVAKDCTDDKEFLYWIHHNLGKSYFELDDLEKASLNFEKALYYAPNDEARSFCNRDLGWVCEKKGDYSKVIEYLEKGAEYFINSESIRKKDIYSGKVNNSVLSEDYWNISVYYSKLNNQVKSDYYMKLSALCGNQEAKEFCRKYNLNYKSL